MARSFDLPRGRFGAILCDPPWRFETWSDKGRDRSPDKHYQTMGTVQIAAMPVDQLAREDCILFLWTTWPKIEDAFIVIEQWGFTYKTCAFCWTKLANGEVQMGTGYWTRANTEPCLLATRGRPQRINRDISQAIVEPRREHSRKPDCVYERIERLVEGPYLELWSRTARAGWTQWGEEVGKYAA